MNTLSDSVASSAVHRSSYVVWVQSVARTYHMQQFERRLIGARIGDLARDDRRVGKAQDQQRECS